ncbi:unnamed protein product [Ranitomeya imitator]|uniref:SOCS box domain-containing protein n=1 Tax=Ranitomeya imitator TaxID=111125 RepID=A0ABN9KZ23_9NEOB|nr:unnamed protein product [Ranitomeya imitator]
MGFYISSLSRSPCTKTQVRHYQVAPSYNYKWTDIHYEASRGNVEKAAGATDHLRRQMGFYISSLSRSPCTKTQVRHYQVAPSYNYKWTDIHYEASRGNVEKLRGLLTTSAWRRCQSAGQLGSDTHVPGSMQRAAGECIRLLVQAGADITYKNKKTGLPPKRLASQVGFIAWIESFSHQPRSLKHLSRLRIRSSLGPQRLRAVRTFNLPQSLKCYLLFEDLVLQEPV